jgi:uncharacterized membrane protein YgdD (TMEM256/DUF423 family)
MARYKVWLVLGAMLGCLAVVLGAFGAHGLEGALESQRSTGDGLSEADIARQLANWETAARYQMYHALALFGVGLLAARRCSVSIHVAGASMTLGTLIFSGCLYALVLTGQRWLGAVVPIGGVLMIVGWVCLGIAAVRHQDPAGPTACG